MLERVEIEDRWPLLLAPLLPLILAGLLLSGASPQLALAVAIGGVLVIGALWLTAFVDVAWLFSLAVALTLFSGNWRQLGLPNLISPDRAVLVVAFLVLMLRDPALGRRPYVRLTPTHGVLLLATVFAICSAVAAGTIGQRSTIFPMIDRYGVAPFLLFLAGPVAFATERQRRILLGTFLAMGAYLGLTALFEGIGANALVFPRYVVEVGAEIQAGRARGPFLAAAINGVALFYCAVAAIVAYVTMPGRWTKRLALAIAALCLFDLIFTQERSVWVGAVAGIVIACLAAPQLRPKLVPVAVAAAAGVALAFLFVPGLQERTTERINSRHTEWDRRNLNRAATNMVLDRPLLGFGLGTFRERSGPYFTQSADYPLTNTGGEIHNVVLSSAAELGLVGTTIWLAALLMAVGGAIVQRGPPELYPWRIGLIAIAVIWVVVANLTPMVQAFPNQMLWLWAGVVWPWRYALVDGNRKEWDDGRPING